jgi:hypothetical protein
MTLPAPLHAYATPWYQNLLPSCSGVPHSRGGNFKQCLLHLAFLRLAGSVAILHF